MPEQPTAQATDTSSLLGRLEGTSATQMTVELVEAINPYLQRIVLTGSLPPAYVAPGQDVMLLFPTEEDRHLRRRYSVRRYEPTDGRLELNIASHRRGPGSRWALEVQPGDVMEVIGPRGKVPLTPAKHHVFLGDLASLAAISSLVESVPEGEDVEAAVLVPGAAAWPELAAFSGAQVTVRYLVAEPSADPAPLLAHLEQLTLPEGTHVYCFGEAKVVRALKAALLERGLSSDSLSTKAYWNAAKPNRGHGEPPKDA